MIQNLIDNIKDQNQEDTIIEYVSVFYLKRPACSKAKRIEYLKKLFFIYGKDHTHEVCNKAKGSLKEYTVLVLYLAKLNCTENQLVREYNSMWQLMMKATLKFKDSTPEPTVTKRFFYSISLENMLLRIPMSAILF